MKTSLAATGFVVIFCLALSARTFVSDPRSMPKAHPVQTDRSALRPFYSAPPVIPHEVMERDSQECLHCHDEVKKLGDRVTLKTPHPHLSNCRQCHIASKPYIGEAPAPVQTTWVGLEEPGKGDRPNEFAPPTIPHRIRMREDCGACHARGTPDPNMKAPHPDRSSCMQCHILTQPDFDF